MADWSYVPEQDPHFRSREIGRVLINRFGDGREIRRQTESFIRNRWTETYIFTATERDSAQDFYDARGLLTSFTKLSYDDSALPATEQTVRFDSVWSETALSTEVFRVELVFVRVIA